MSTPKRTSGHYDREQRLADPACASHVAKVVVERGETRCETTASTLAPSHEYRVGRRLHEVIGATTLDSKFVADDTASVLYKRRRVG